VELGISIDEAINIANELNKKYRYTSSILGFDFLKKAKSSNLADAFMEGLEDNIDEVNKILKGAIEQNQVAAIIQNGHALKMIPDPSTGLWKCVDELVTEINIRTYVDELGGYVDVAIPADAFTPQFIKNGDSIELQIKGFDGILEGLNPTSSQYKAYNELNNLIQSALDEAGLSLEYIDDLSGSEIAGLISEMQQKIYLKLITTCDENGNFLFESLNAFDNGQVYSCIETLSDQGDETIDYLARMFEAFGVATYQGHQHWDNPLGSAFKYLFQRTDDMDESWKAYHKFLFGHVAKSGEWEVEDMEEMFDIMKRLDEEPELFAEFGQQLMRDLTRPLAVPDGHWFNNANTKKAFVFFDEETLEPIRVASSQAGGHADDTVAGMLYDLNDFFAERAHMNKNLLRRPLRISKSGDLVRVRWSQSAEVVEAWRKHLAEIGIPSSILDKLDDGISFSARSGNFKEKLIAFVVIWYEYRKSWDEFADWIQEGFAANRFTWHAGVDVADAAGRFRHNMGRWQYLNDADEWVNVHLGTAPRYAQSGPNSVNIYQEVNMRGGMNIIPSHNTLFQYYVDKIINEFCRLILNKPESGSIEDIMEYIFQNWNF